MNPNALASEFHSNGFVVLQDILPQTFVEECRSAAQSNFDECLAYIEQHKLPFGMHAVEGYKEIVQRNRGRYEVPFGLQREGIFQSSLLLKNERLISLLDAIFPCEVASSSCTFTPTTSTVEAPTSEEAKEAAVSSPDIQSLESMPTSTVKRSMGSVVKTETIDVVESRGQDERLDEQRSWHLLGRSVVTATPGAAEQQWHVDGAHVDVSNHRPCHVLNVFLPLVDLSEDNGPTELRPGSHFLSRDLARLTLLAKALPNYEISTHRSTLPN